MTIYRVIKVIEGKSDFYATRKVIDYIESFSVEGKNGPENEVITALERIARVNGFNPQNTLAVRDEGNGVLRIGESLKRIIGFNATVNKRFDFIALDCFRKPDTRRSKDQSKKYKKVERAKRTKSWEVVQREDEL